MDDSQALVHPPEQPQQTSLPADREAEEIGGSEEAAALIALPCALVDGVQLRLDSIQAIVSSLQYNYTGLVFYPLKKSGGTAHMLAVYDLIMAYKLPIQCVEAVFIGSVLTDPYAAVDRFPLCFKSRYQSHLHRHIVLMVHCNGRWGALGISRRPCLMNKPLVFSSAADLIEEFRVSYESVFHRLLTVYVGRPIPHHMQVDQPVVWKALKLRLNPSLSAADGLELQQFLQKQSARKPSKPLTRNS